MGGFLPLGCVYIYYTMQYEISGSVLAGQITTTTWAVAPSRTWAWSRAIGGAGRGIGGAWPVRVVDQGGSAQDHDQGGGSGGPGHGTPQAFNSAVELPRARLGRRQRSIGPGRAVYQGGSARDVGLGGGSVEDLGMNASTLEHIRFAAANRLCVNVGYEGDVQRVEPYSLRKARGGNVVLYACEAGSSECATYRTGGISEVEVTRQTFVPKYANELLSPGR